MMKIFRIILIFIFIVTAGCMELSAQDTPVATDTTQSVRKAKSSSRGKSEAIVKADGNQPVERVHTTDSALQKKHSPKIAIALSAVLPGAGQVYNKKAWKIPIFLVEASPCVAISVLNGELALTSTCIVPMVRPNCSVPNSPNMMMRR